MVRGRSDVEELDRLGCGGFGTLARIRHRHTSQEMAMKTVALHNMADRRRFLNEFMVLQANCEYITGNTVSLKWISNCRQFLGFFAAIPGDASVYLVIELMDFSMRNLRLGDTGFVSEGHIRWIAFSVLQAVAFMDKELNMFHRG